MTLDAGRFFLFLVMVIYLFSLRARIVCFRLQNVPITNFRRQRCERHISTREILNSDGMLPQWLEIQNIRLIIGEISITVFR